MKENKKLIILFLFLVFILFQSPIFIIDSKSNQEMTFIISISRTFKNLNSKPSYFEFYFPESYIIANSQLNIQSYSSVVMFNPEPDNKNFEYDQFQNKILKFSYSNIYGFSVNIKIKGVLKLNNNNISYIPYPYDERDIPSSLYIFLENSTDSMIFDFANEMAKNKSNLLSILLSIKNYIDNNIKYSPFYIGRTPQKILTEKIANREELIDFYASILRTLGIPVRVCCGLSIPQKYEFNEENKKDLMEMYSCKGIVTYLEIWTKDYGWIFFDPFFSLITSLNNIIKFGHAQYVNQLHYIYFESKSLNISMKDDYNIEFSYNNPVSFFKIKKNIFDYFIIFQNNFYNNFEQTLLKNNENRIQNYYTGFDDIENKTLYYYGFDTKKEINLKDQAFLQNFYVEKDYKVKKLILNIPVINGKINVRLYKGSDINEKNLLYQTYIEKNTLGKNENRIIEIDLFDLKFQNGLYTIYIFVAEPTKDCIFSLDEAPNLPGFFPLIIVKDNISIKTNLVLPMVFKYD